jgi:hypothetical protein
MQWWNLRGDSENCAGGSVITGRVSLDGQVMGDDPGLPVWMFGVEIATPPHKTNRILRNLKEI